MFYIPIGAGMTVAFKRNFEEEIGDLKKLENMIEPLEKMKVSLFDEINFRLSFSMNAWPPSGISKKLPEEKLERLPKQLKDVLDVYYKTSEVVKEFYSTIKDDGEKSIGAYLEIRKDMIGLVMDIRRGLVKEAVKKMRNVLSLLKENIHHKGEHPKEDFNKFWNEYSIAREYFESIFLISFPEEYNPSSEPVYSAALDNALKMEIDLLDFALRGEFVEAIDKVNELSEFMDDFTMDQTSRIIPKRII